METSVSVWTGSLPRSTKSDPTRIMRVTDRGELVMTTAVDVDLRIDLQTMDETGLPWTFLDQAPDPSRIVPGRHIVAGSGAAVAVAVVVDITDEGIVHVHPLSGSVASNAHLLDTDPASGRLPDPSPDPVETSGTGRDQTEPTKPETPTGTRPDGTRRHRPGRGSSNS